MSKAPDFSLHTGHKGGAALGRTRDFMKEPDAFRTDTGPGARQDYGGSKTNKRTGDKSLKAVKPRT